MTKPSRRGGQIRVVFLGNDPWSVPTLVRLARDDRFDVLLTLTNPPRPAGRGSRPRSTAVAEAARGLRLPLEEAETTSDPRLFERLRTMEPDALVVVAYGELLRAPLLTLPRLGALNVHFSLLPRWRGASPVQHAILAGDTVTGVTVMQMDEGLDTGPVLARRVEPVEPFDDAGSLGLRLSELGATLLVGTLADLAAGRIVPEAQSGRPTTAPKLGRDARRLVWTEPATDVVRRVRAFAPDPGAEVTWRGQTIKVLGAETVPPADVVYGSPGAIAAIDAAGVVVAAGSAAVRLLDLVPAGRRRMDAAAWARGARAAIGESFV